ncbi:hypothetical protein FXN63_02465 [Pigmentiphaga aceris]|uniref:Uncharacterized protein n=1 Tax=Pigmentiphaga aceris TaxID=1940612 RepID=A0A5C0ARQ8_9BURK|nr:hypothetical protein [Pigmentiphaga aceris]QEI04829.1 hypothetical protein FXN63_02465 [Pigmentiphaga aceris]
MLDSNATGALVAWNAELRTVIFACSIILVPSTVTSWFSIGGTPWVVGSAWHHRHAPLLTTIHRRLERLYRFERSSL